MRRMVLLIAVLLLAALTGCASASSDPANGPAQARFAQAADLNPFDDLSYLAKLKPQDQLAARTAIVKIKGKLAGATSKPAQGKVLAQVGCDLEKSLNERTLSPAAFNTAYGFTAVEYNRRFDPRWGKNPADNSSLLTNAERKYCTPNVG